MVDIIIIIAQSALFLLQVHLVATCKTFDCCAKRESQTL